MRVITATAGPGRYFSPIMATTRDAKPKSKIDPLFLAMAHQAVKSMSIRLDRLEQAVHQKDLTEQGLNPVAIINAAAQKAALHRANLYAEKVNRSIQEHNEVKTEEADNRPRDIKGGLVNSEPPPDDRFQHTRLDISSGAHAQKSPQFQMGDASNFVTPQQAKAMFAARDAARKAEQRAFDHEAKVNRDFRARDAALIQDMKSQIERGLKEQYE